MTGVAGGALAGIRVLDFSQVIFGPSCTAILADHGAEVIKVERPGQGDLARAFGPFRDGESLPYASLNRNKLGLAVNLKAPEGRDIIYRLIPTVDVVVSNFRAGVMESLGLDYETVSRLNPRLIYAIGSGYGQSGPYAERGKGGHESLAQALSGAIHANIGRDGLPRRLPVSAADIGGGHVLAEGILLALLARERTGRGQRVEVALLDGMMWMQAWAVAGAANLSAAADGGRGGNPLDGGVYRTRDGCIVVTGLFKPNPLRDICQALGLDDLSADARFASVEAMREHADELRALLQAPLLTRTTAEWIPCLEAADILCAPVQSVAEAIDDPQVVHNQMVVATDLPRLGTLRTVGVPAKLSATPGSVRTPPPAIGEHTPELLAQLGYDEAMIADLRRRQIVAWPDEP
jgi:formyl-CoA transferase